MWVRSFSLKRLGGGVVVALGVTTLVGSFVRLHFGVDFTDEAYYLALAYRYFLGDLAYVDELNLTQSGSFLSYPLLRTWFAFNGVEGGILFSRYCYFFLTFLASTFTFFTFRRLYRGWHILLPSLVPVALMPHAIPTLNYNSLGMLFFFFGILCFLQTRLLERGGGWALASGIFHGLSILAYLPMGVGVAAFGLCALATAPRLRDWRVYAVSGLSVVALFFLAIGPDQIFHSLAYTSHLPDNRSQKLFTVVWELFLGHPNKVLLAGLLFCLIRFMKNFWWVTLLFWVCIPLLFIPKLSWGSSLLYVGSLGMLSPLFLIHSKKSKQERSLFVLLWIPCVSAGIVTGFSSNNWTTNSGFGLLGACVLFGIWFSVFLSQKLQVSVAAALSGSLVLIPLLWFQRAVFREDPLKYLNTRVTWGPFAGLYTTNVKESYLRLLNEDLKRVTKVPATILFYEFFPAGYLLTPMRPATNSVFKCNYFKDPSECVQAHQTQLSDWNVAVHIKYRFESTLSDQTDPYVTNQEVHQSIQEQFTLRIHRPQYEIYTLSRPSIAPISRLP